MIERERELIEREVIEREKESVERESDREGERVS